mgnify:FL=1
MEIESAFLMFFSGVIAHAVGVRIFNIWNKSLVYKTTYISCLAILRMADGMAQEILKAAEPEDHESIDTAFGYWRKLSLHSLKDILSDKIWKQMCYTDWDKAMRTISALERLGAETENDI